MTDMVQISEVTLKKVYHLLNLQRVRYISKANKAGKPENANKYMALAHGYDVLLDEIAASLDAKEEP